MVDEHQVEKAYRAALARLGPGERWAVQLLVDASAIVQFGDRVVERRLQQLFRVQAAQMNAAAATSGFTTSPDAA